MNIWTNRKWKPMLLKEIEKPFDNKEYIYEIKFDGIRAILFVTKNKIKIMSRNNVDLTYLFPELESITKIVKKNTIFDGEIISIDDKNLPSFSKLSERLHLKNKVKIKQNSLNNKVTFIAFDILYEGKELTNLPLLKRKEILSLYKDTDEFIKTKYIEEKGIKLFKEIKKLKLEGIVAKLKNSYYHINERTNDFIKIKNIQREEFLICGYTTNTKNISLYIGEQKNKKIEFVGKCSLSMNNSNYKKIIEKNNNKNPFNNYYKKINYIKPIKCLIEFTERTKSNNLRHPSLKKLLEGEK